MRRKSDYPLLKGQVTARFNFGRIHFSVQNRPKNCPFWQCVVVILVATKAGLPADTGGDSSVGSAFRTGTIRSALDFVPARLAQILTLALLTSASLPKYISLNKAFRPDF